MNLRTLLVGVILFFGVGVFAQLGSGAPGKNQFVSFEGAPKTSITLGKVGHVDLQFRVARGDHINSSRPGSELLIPTKLSLSAPGELLVGDVTYPPGKQLTLAIAPDEKLNVYSGDFTLGASFTPTRKTTPGNYRIHGQLRYQACSDRACYPPQNLPVQFDVKVLRPTSSHRRNPPQSPHAHR
jgi:DsbC/DsbD-like thiol-disulfide interchange protein